MPKIQVRVERGCVTAIEDIPVETTIEVIDYDTEKYDGAQLSKDGDGRPCSIQEWRAPE
jgi:hypothetical protein